MVVRTYTVAPSASRLTGSLRDIGYDFPTAVADLVDNSLAADAAQVQILIELDESGPVVMIADDGTGMSANRANEALRFGSRRTYRIGDLGRYGLGLKTASLSQCRSVSVMSRRPGFTNTVVRQLSLDLIEQFDEWLVVAPRRDRTLERAQRMLDEQMSTVIVWQHLDRAFSGRDGSGGWARRRLASLTARTAEHLAVVFHRQLAGVDAQQVSISVNGEKLSGWDPYATGEPSTSELAPLSFELDDGYVRGTVRLRRWILPHRRAFSSAAEFDRHAGPLKWNRQQGIYIYRADRLIQWGGWAGLRAIDEHTKLARCSLEFNTDLDAAFHINVAKRKVGVPTGLRQMLEKPIMELCQHAEDRYRNAVTDDPPKGGPGRDHRPRDETVLGVALLSAAVRTGHLDALRVIAAALRDDQPEMAVQLGLDQI